MQVTQISFYPYDVTIRVGEDLVYLNHEVKTDLLGLHGVTTRDGGRWL